MKGFTVEYRPFDDGSEMVQMLLTLDQVLDHLRQYGSENVTQVTDLVSGRKYTREEVLRMLKER